MFLKTTDRKQTKLLVASVVAMLCISSLASAQWVSDSTENTPVCTASGVQQNPKVCSDGNDGVIITWEDYRSGHWDIYAQKFDKYGYPHWAENGVLLCNTTTAKNLPVIAADGDGGAYVVWKDQRRSSGMVDLYGQHILSDGSLGYGSAGMPVDSVPNAVASSTSADNPTICGDGNGNAYVMWEESRSSITSNSRPDIYGNRLTPNGPSWGKNGRAIISFSAGQSSPRIIPDGLGGCYLAWVNAGLPSSIMITRVNSSGSATWNGGNGIQVYQGTAWTGDISRNPVLTRDGNQVLVAWETKNSVSPTRGWNVYAQRFKNDGTRVWGTSTTAFEISTDYLGDQTDPVIFSDDSILTTSGYAGVMVVFQTDISTKYIVMTRGIGDGINYTPAAPKQMFLVCSQFDQAGYPADQISPVAVKAGNGQVLTAWVDYRLSRGTSTVKSIYAQRLDKTPRRYLGPSPATSSWGVPISNRSNSNADELVMVPRSDGGIAVWRDDRNGSTNQDIYAQLIFVNGTLPIELASFDVRASAHGDVFIGWQTATEKNNAGFEIERRRIDDPNASSRYETIASYTSDSRLRGGGTLDVPREYNYVDAPSEAGTYEYRLVDYTLDGERNTHPSKQIEIGKQAAGETSVGTCFPNPFSNETYLPLTLSAESLVTVRLADVLGRVVSTPLENVVMTAGSHRLAIHSSGLNGSGTYYLEVEVRDAKSGAVIYRSSNVSALQLVR